MDAVNGAVETRREPAGQHAGLSGDRRTDCRMNCRIGTDPGKVVVKNGVIRGDRVNGAAVTHCLTVEITAHIVLA